jgi:hypothetical protein
MPVALPSGWIDTGQVGWITVTGKIQFLLTPDRGGSREASFGWVPPGMWRFSDESFNIASAELLCPNPPVQRTGYFRLKIQNPALLLSTYLVNQQFFCLDPPRELLTPVFGYEETTGPYRLGVKLTLIEEEAPDFAADYELTYRS